MMNSSYSIAEWIIATTAVLGFLVSVFTGVRAFYVNEYRIKVLEQDVAEVRQDIRELMRNVSKLLGFALHPKIWQKPDNAEDD